MTRSSRVILRRGRWRCGRCSPEARTPTLTLDAGDAHVAGMTAEHPIWVVSRNAWVVAGELSVEGPEHTFFADDVLAHNKSIACPSPSLACSGPDAADGAADDAPDAD